VGDSALRTGLAVGLAGVLAGVFFVVMLSHRLTRQMRELVASMAAVAAGDMDREVPVTSGDDVGQLAVQFNHMIAQTRELLTRIVQEETRKQHAEYQLLEYRYRSLQSQINPHFIYNAMEAVNALAKIDGNKEICEVVQSISAYFRQNARNMQKRYVTVHSEIGNLKQYAGIYGHIYGDRLRTSVRYGAGVGDALLPTMILQPVLENALMHGVSAAQGESFIEITADQEGGERLVIHVRDNGKGMPPEVVERILSGRSAHGGEDRKTSGIGMSNVLQRLRLIYGSAAGVSIDSRAGEGTDVRISLPLAYDMPDIDEE